MSELSSVIFNFAMHKKEYKPVLTVMDGRTYKITDLNMHYTYRKGATLFHVFCVSSGNLSLKLVFDTSSLIWKVEETYDDILG